MNATVIKSNGDKISLLEWQKIYNLPVGSSQIGKRFSIGERSILEGCEFSELLIRLLDTVRESWGKPINLNSFDRTDAKQKQLLKQGYRTAKFSPHVVKMAADIDTKDNKETEQLVKVIKQAAELLGLNIRIGYKSYMKDGSTFVHVDVTPEYYAKGKPFNKIKHPWQWEKPLIW